MENCLVCGLKPKRLGYKYCLNKCQQEHQHRKFIETWKDNQTSSTITKNVSKHIKRYLLRKFNGRCFICGWGERNPVTGNLPLEVDHVDGDATNNTESNLRILCPNCHSLTSNFRNLNRGKGRVWRQK